VARPKGGTRAKPTSTASSTRFTVTRTTSLWRVTFDNPPINLIDPMMIVELHRLLDEIEGDNEVAVVLFDSADPDYFLARYDILADATPFEALPPVANRNYHWTNFLNRLSKSPAVTISAIRGRARAAGSEPSSRPTSASPAANGPSWDSSRSASPPSPAAAPPPACPASSAADEHSRSCSAETTTTANWPNATATSTAPSPTTSSSSSSTPSRSASPASTYSPSPASNASSTTHRSPTDRSPRRWTPSLRPSRGQPHSQSSRKQWTRASSSAATSNSTLAPTSETSSMTRQPSPPASPSIPRRQLEAALPDTGQRPQREYGKARSRTAVNLGDSRRLRPPS
jgi:Enoyl-CoA hydratase/isomerase